MYQVETSTVSPSSTGVAGWDVSYSVNVDGHTIDGEVTLVVSEANGRPTAWGAPDNWVDGRSLRSLLLIKAYKSILSAIESATSDAIVASGCEPSDACDNG